nr:MAG TPA: hypothetical protein [Bacteriophage sp.]
MLFGNHQNPFHLFSGLLNIHSIPSQQPMLNHCNHIAFRRSYID